MQPQCRVCRHAQHEAINAALRGEESLHALSRQYGFDRKALRTHRAKHLPPVPVAAAPAVSPVPLRPVPPPAAPDRLIDERRPALGTIAQLRAYYAQR
jgi:hypothetical protein